MWASASKSPSRLPPAGVPKATSMSDRSRPSSSTNCQSSSSMAARSSTVSSGGVFVVADRDLGAGKGVQPSPYRATRRRDSRLLPPIQIGGADPGLRIGGQPLGVDADALEGEVVLGPHPAEDLDGLVEQRVALLELDAQAPVLATQIAGGHGQGEAVLRQHGHGGHHLGDDEGMTVGEHDDVGDQADPLGHRGAEGQRHEGIQRVVAPGLEPPVGRRRMIGESDPVEPRGFRGPGEFGDGLLVMSSGLAGWVIRG